MNNNWPFAPLEQNAYGLAMVDPPWDHLTWSAKGRGKSASQHYATMTLDDIKGMPIRELAHRDGMWVWLWTTRDFQEAAHDVLRAWGATFSTSLIWRKLTKNGKPWFGLGRVGRTAHEPILIGRFGKPKVHSRSVRTVIDGITREHSRKPDEAYRAAEQLFGDVRRADVFARESRPGWETWGFEAQKFDKEAA